MPILIVTAQSEEGDLVRGLGAGANDYITKPFRPLEFVARVNCHLAAYERLNKRRDSQASILRFGELVVSPLSRRVTVYGKEVELTNKEFSVLYFLAQNPNVIFSKEDLFSNVWRGEATSELYTVVVHVNSLRRKLGGEWIQTVWGMGYRFNTL